MLRAPNWKALISLVHLLKSHHRVSQAHLRSHGKALWSKVLVGDEGIDWACTSNSPSIIERNLSRNLKHKPWRNVVHWLPCRLMLNQLSYIAQDHPPRRLVSPTAVNSQDNLSQLPHVLAGPSDQGSPPGEPPFSGDSRLHEGGTVIIQRGVFVFRSTVALRNKTKSIQQPRILRYHPSSLVSYPLFPKTILLVHATFTERMQTICLFPCRITYPFKFVCVRYISNVWDCAWI